MTNPSPPAGSSLPQARLDDSDSASTSATSDYIPNVDSDHSLSDIDTSSDPETDALSPPDSHSPSHSNYPAQPHTGSHSHPHAGAHSHSHLHSHDLRRLRHTHGRAPRDSAPDKSVRRRQDTVDDGGSGTVADDLLGGATTVSAAPSLVTQVIQTVSLIQIVDGFGSPIETQTLYAPPATVVVDPASGITVAISIQDISATPAAPAADPASSDNVPSESSTASTVNPTSTTILMSSSTSLSLSQSLSSISLDTTSNTITNTVLNTISTSNSESMSLTTTALTTAPSANGFLLPSISKFHNGTNTHSSNHNTSSIATPSNSSRMKIFGHTTTPTTRSFTSSSHKTSTSHSTSLSESIFSTISSDIPNVTEGANNGGIGGGSQPSSTAAADSSDGDGSDLSPQEKKVIGGVVGGVAGAAFFLLLMLLALRYKRRRDAKAGLADGLGGVGTRGITGGGGGGPEDGSGGAMAERSGPYGITAALAGLAAKRRTLASTGGSETEGGERGFYRVSGRKLPSVLQTGGDGYSDPRESMMSGTSDYYRGSQAFDPISGTSTRLALGSPMRPVSGVPVMRSGPARTPVREDPMANPFDDPPPSPPPILDPLGRTMASQDGSRGSGSRFQEEI